MSAIGQSPGAKLVNVQFVTDDKNGNSTAYTYEGSQAECIAQRFLDRAAGATHTMLSPRGDGYWTLTASYPFDTDTGAAAEPVSDVHELDVEIAQQSVYTNPKFRGLLGDYEDELLSVLKTAVDKYQSGGNGTGADAQVDAEADLSAACLAAVPTAGTKVNVILRAFRNICYRGQDTFLETRVVYRRTLSAASPLQVQASFVGANCIWTTPELRAAELLPESWWFTLPTDLLWHKSQPVVNTVAGQKTQIAYHYTSLTSASALFYDVKPNGAAVLLDADPGAPLG